MKLFKGKLLFVIIGLLVIVGAGGGVYFLQPQLLPFGKPEAASAAEPPAEHQDNWAGPVYALKERIVNLKAGGPARYLKVAISVEFASKVNYNEFKGEENKKKQEEFKHEISPREYLLQDAVTTIISSKSADELATGEGKEQLREELRERFEKLLVEPKVVKVYFTEFTMQ